MLPEALSAGLCSLKPGEDRACLAAHLRIDASGTLLDWRFERALMRSAQRLTYDGVQQAVAQGGAGLAAPVRDAIPALYGVYGALRAARERRGALDLDLPERTVTLAEDGTVARIGFARRYDSHRLIEEMMIAANVAAAGALEAPAHALPCTASTTGPTWRSSTRCASSCADAGSPCLAAGRSAPSPSTASSPASTIRATPRFASLMILRAQAQAAYSPGNIGHFGLGLARYAHFTSPIRRYADLLVHRALIAAYGLGAGGAGDAEAGALERLGSHISTTERRAQAAERDAGDCYCAAYLAGRIGAEFQGRIAGVTRFGVFVSLDETGAEGLVPGRTLGAARPRHDARRHTLEVDGRTLRLGDPVVVALREADPAAGGLVFSLLAVKGDAWQPSPQRDGGRRGRRRTRR